MEKRVEKESPVAFNKNWSDRVHAELIKAKSWEKDWGFLAGASDPSSLRAKLAKPDALDTLLKELKVTTFPLKEHPERAWRALAQKSKSANEADIGTDVDELLNTFVKTRTPARSNMVYLNNPKDIYTRPVLTSHEYGWGKSLEVFGPLKAFTQRFPGHQASRT